MINLSAKSPHLPMKIGEERLAERTVGTIAILLARRGEAKVGNQERLSSLLAIALKVLRPTFLVGGTRHLPLGLGLQRRP